MTVTDTLGRTDTYTGVISTSDAILNIYPTGKGMGLGKYAEQENLLDVKWPARLRGGATSDGKLLLPNNLGLEAALTNGKMCNLITRLHNDNLWIGTADEGIMERRGSVYRHQRYGQCLCQPEQCAGQDPGLRVCRQAAVGRDMVRGSITVPNTSQYKLFMIYTPQTTAGAAMATPILGMKYNNSWIRGPGGYNSASALYISTVAVTLSGNTWTLSQVASDNLGSRHKTDIVITDIYGLI